MRPEWMKAKGYLHLTPSLFLHSHWKTYKSKIENPSYISRYAFFPLIHSIISERKFKKKDPLKFDGNRRSHSHKRKDNGKIQRNTKKRPIHYASHFDALIYSYYGYLLNNQYAEVLQSDNDLDRAVIAYRKIKISETEAKGKSTIHFAKEVFDEIKARAKVKDEVGVLTFDIENFFPSLDHDFLKQKWIELVGEKEFERHHFNVFKSCTQFRYVLLDDLRKNEKRNCFEEKDLAKIRREKGYKCFFPSVKDFRIAIREGNLPVY